MPDTATVKTSRESQPRFPRFLYRVYRRYAGLSNVWRRRLTPVGWVVLCMLVMSAMAGLDTNRSTAYQLFTLLAALGLVSILFNLFFRPRFRLTRHCPRFASVDTPFSYHVTVESLDKRAYHGLTLREFLAQAIPSRGAFLVAHEPGESERNRFDRTFLFYRWLWLVQRARGGNCDESQPFSLPAKGRTEVAMEVAPLRRGVLQFTDCRLLRPDLFGLLKPLRRPREGVADAVTVLPKRYPLPPISLSGRSQYQPCGVALAGSVGQSEEFMGLREYRAGDPIRHFHWKSWARTGKPMVIEFEDEFFPRYALVLDTFAEFDPDNVFEEAVSIAASFACTLDTKDSLLDLMFVGSEAYCFTSGRGTSQPERLLEILASVELCRDGTFGSLDGLVSTHVDQLSACLLILIDWDDPRKECVKRLRSLGIDVMVLVICPPDDPRTSHRGEEGVHFLNAARIAEGLAKL